MQVLDVDSGSTRILKPVHCLHAEHEDQGHVENDEEYDDTEYSHP